MDYEDTPVPKYKTDLCESRPVVVTMKGIEELLVYGSRAKLMLLSMWGAAAG
jgi:hypothetical protein